MNARILLLLLGAMIVAPAPAAADTPEGALRDSFDRRQQINRIGMSVLGGWAVGNIALGSTLYLTGVGDPAFHQMNALWNTVNLGLATAGLFQAFRGTIPTSAALEIRAQHRIEKILLLNAGLDVGYMAFGLYLMNLDSGPLSSSFAGWGRSLLVQGGFLFAFDLVMFVIHSRNREYERILPGHATR